MSNEQILEILTKISFCLRNIIHDKKAWSEFHLAKFENLLNDMKKDFKEENPKTEIQDAMEDLCKIHNMRISGFESNLHSLDCRLNEYKDKIVRLEYEIKDKDSQIQQISSINYKKDAEIMKLKYDLEAFNKWNQDIR